MEPLARKNRYVIYRDFLSNQEQLDLANEALVCHERSHKAPHHHQLSSTAVSTDWSSLKEATASSKLNLGIPCGSSLEPILPLAVKVSRQLFSRACHDAPSSSSILSDLAKDDSILTGLALLYGPKATMSPHYDSPTQPGQQQEWLCMMTMGANIHFILDDVTVTMRSGDCLVMDSMAVRHGVEGIGVEEHHPLVSRVLPIQGARLGILVWQGRVFHHDKGGANQPEEAQVEGMSMLFGDE